MCRGPLNLLVWISLSHDSYRGVPRVAAARKGLCRQAHAALMVEWQSKRHVHENLNATTAEGCDVRNSNPFCESGQRMIFNSPPRTSSFSLDSAVLHCANNTLIISAATALDLRELFARVDHWGANSGYIAMREAMSDAAFGASILAQ